MVHEVPDIVVSTTEALVKCGIFMVSIAFDYAILVRILALASLRNGAYRPQSVSLERMKECRARFDGNAPGSLFPGGGTGA